MSRAAEGPDRGRGRGGFPHLVVRNPDGQIETVQYHKLTPMLLNELQKQNAELAAQKEEINALRDRLARTEAALERLSTANSQQP